MDQTIIRKILNTKLHWRLEAVEVIFDYLDDEMSRLACFFDHLCNQSVETLYRSGKRGIRGCLLGAIHIKRHDHCLLKCPSP